MGPCCPKLLQEIEPFASFEVTLLMCTEQDRFVSRWIASNLNVVTRSTVVEEVKRGGKLVKLREPRMSEVCVKWRYVLWEVCVK